jgi:Raf kinase inhibitor-like YbhB/YbcL family protein
MQRIGWTAMLGVALLAGCGGGGDDDDNTGAGTGGIGAGTGGTTVTGTGGTTMTGTGGMTMTGSGGMTMTGSGGTNMTGTGGTTMMADMDAGGGGDMMPMDAGGSSGGTFEIMSMAFADGSTIADKYRCTGPSPDLKWSGAPAGTMSYAITLIDATPAGTNGLDTAGTQHWVIYDIPKTTTMLAEGVMAGYMPTTPMGAKQAKNYNGANGFQGPCYPIAPSTAMYDLTLYAIDAATLPGLTMSSSADDVIAAIMAHTVGSTKLTITSTTM